MQKGSFNPCTFSQDEVVILYNQVPPAHSQNLAEGSSIVKNVSKSYGGL